MKKSKHRGGQADFLATNGNTRVCPRNQGILPASWVVFGTMFSGIIILKNAHIFQFWIQFSVVIVVIDAISRLADGETICWPDAIHLQPGAGRTLRRDRRQPGEVDSATGGGEGLVCQSFRRSAAAGSDTDFGECLYGGKHRLPLESWPNR